MKNRAKYWILCTLCISTFSCRPLGDNLLSYGQPDTQALSQAEKSYAEEFKAFWLAMNENYGIWDYEESFGMDWDEIYRTYLPRFQALDTMQNGISDRDFLKLYLEFCDSLHDGHLLLQIKNIKTGNYISIRPSADRIDRERDEVYKQEQAFALNLDAYRTDKVAAAYRIKVSDRTGSRDICFEICDSTAARILRASAAYIATVDSLGGPDTTNVDFYNAVKDLNETTLRFIDQIKGDGSIPRDNLFSNTLSLYQQLQKSYSQIAGILGVEMMTIDDAMASDILKTIEYALFEGNIAYLRIGGFGLTQYMEQRMQSQNSTPLMQAYQEAVHRVWNNWFDTIQTLHQQGTLGGVIIDVRNNGGGYLNDYKFVLGALLPSGGFESHSLRMKTGSGRHDFGPMMPFVFPTLPVEHEVINDKPIIVLANTNSVSMAEMTTWGVKSQPNGCFVGMRTYGGLSALNPDARNYSDNYSGAFGVNQQTPIYGYVPKFIGFFPQHDGSLRILESIGFEPDIEVRFDTTLWSVYHRDNQLERALHRVNE